MSQSQVADAIGASEFQVRYFLRSEQVKALLGKDFKNVKIPIENSRNGRGGRGHIASIPTKLVSAFWVHQLGKGNIKAQALVYACVEEALERRCDRAFEQVKSEREYEDEKDTRIVRTLGGNQQMLCISESGLYSLVLTSRKPEESSD